MTGWIKIHRSIFDHWVSTDPIKFRWWIIMISDANYCDKKFVIGNKVYNINVGECVYSLRTWANKFGCSVNTVNSFFDMLENDKMIERKIIGKGKQSSTLVIISNYSKYQIVSDTLTDTQNDTLTDTRKERKLITTKEGKEGKEDKNKGIDFSNVRNEFLPVVELWLEYKNEKKQPYKQTGFNTMLKKLYEKSNNNPSLALRMIEDAMSKNYSGFFEIKEKQQPKQTVQTRITLES